MKLRPEQLSSQLKKSLSPVYLITGDEPLISEECSDLVRINLQQQGFSEREVLHVDAKFSWEYLLECANALSLFAEKKIIELRLGSQKLNKKSSEILQSYLANPSPDNILLITADKIDGNAKKSAWFKAVDKSGVVVEIWPVEAEQLPNWIRQRAAQIELQLDEEAIQLLCDRIEGNLLAAKQELSKLSLLFPRQVVTADDVIDSVSDSSRYDIYGLTDAALNGQAPRCYKILQVLKQDGTEPPIILWALSKELRTLAAIQQAQQNGQSFDAVCQRERIWGKRKPLARKAAQRLSTQQINTALKQCAEVDKTVKGMAIGDAWLLLSSIALTLAGQPLDHLNTITS
ncbi:MULTISPECIES: DNA polymerase III subunit delta [unclassified Neptuniibacter]|uniref:DNA polymerase III subunit delta n=1 Tax=unclassified Neptuniibacter TaxID=2630693 RepID=UPI000C35B4B7|nr:MULTISPECIES: DNA polymerase III subunit delta [unclassified Neptuniibacter]MAY41814.1 DNA polymerase III subunit delta [Oceanospirillaceae bacterium]|tara:strand:+ start:7197 stop:8231 length:1035 start_codon:yes stop_codon:yes gene_type:complete